MMHRTNMGDIVVQDWPRIVLAPSSLPVHRMCVDRRSHDMIVTTSPCDDVTASSLPSYRIVDRMGTSLYHAIRSKDGTPSSDVDVAMRFVLLDVPVGAEKGDVGDEFIECVRQRMPQASSLPETATVVVIVEVLLFVMGDDGERRWYAVFVLEKMDGNVRDLIASDEFRDGTVSERCEETMGIVRKMVATICDAEATNLSSFRDGIDLCDFLYRRSPGSVWDVRMVDVPASDHRRRRWYSRQPPEYDLLDKVSTEARDDDMSSKTVANRDWRSRMLAFEVANLISDVIAGALSGFDGAVVRGVSVFPVRSLTGEIQRLAVALNDMLVRILGSSREGGDDRRSSHVLTECDVMGSIECLCVDDSGDVTACRPNMTELETIVCGRRIPSVGGSRDIPIPIDQ